ncbi:MAG: hypothetical protein AAF960_21105 [Bacteroidota bacterium]
MKHLNQSELKQIQGGNIFMEAWDAFVGYLQDLADRANPLVDHTPQS